MLSRENSRIRIVASLDTLPSPAPRVPVIQSCLCGHLFRSKDPFSDFELQMPKSPHSLPGFPNRSSENPERTRLRRVSSPSSQILCVGCPSDIGNLQEKGVTRAPLCRPRTCEDSGGAVNLVLNYAYGVLEDECRRAVNAIGLEPSVGFLYEFANHKTKQSLVYDFPKSQRDCCWPLLRRVRSNFGEPGHLTL